MERVFLPGTGRATTRLGFGGVKLFGGPARRESLRLLEAAYDAGVRHFDVAPRCSRGPRNFHRPRRGFAYPRQVAEIRQPARRAAGPKRAAAARQR